MAAKWFLQISVTSSTSTEFKAEDQETDTAFIMILMIKEAGFISQTGKNTMHLSILNKAWNTAGQIFRTDLEEEVMMYGFLSLPNWFMPREFYRIFMGTTHILASIIIMFDHL